MPGENYVFSFYRPVNWAEHYCTLVTALAATSAVLLVTEVTAYGVETTLATHPISDTGWGKGIYSIMERI